MFPLRIESSRRQPIRKPFSAEFSGVEMIKYSGNILVPQIKKSSGTAKKQSLFLRPPMLRTSISWVESNESRTGNHCDNESSGIIEDKKIVYWTDKPGNQAL
jgi:hypothetical protein